MQKNRYSTKMLTLMAMLAAMAYVAMLITRPLPKVNGFLSYDLKDVVVAIGGFMLGTVPAVLITLVVSVLELAVSGTGPIGLLMNVLSTLSFVVPATIVYNKRRSLQSAGLGLALGVLCMAVVMLVWNYIITPIYQGVPRSVVAGMLLPVFLPFNLSKGCINAGITMLVYKPVAEAVRRAGLLESVTAQPSPKRKFNLTATLISVFVLATGVVAFVLMIQPKESSGSKAAEPAVVVDLDAMESAGVITAEQHKAIDDYLNEKYPLEAPEGGEAAKRPEGLELLQALAEGKVIDEALEAQMAEFAAPTEAATEATATEGTAPASEGDAPSADADAASADEAEANPDANAGEAAASADGN